MSNKGGLLRFLRFAIVGIGNTLIDLLCFSILTWCGVYYLAAQVAAYSAGVINSYFCNRIWTFKITRGEKGQAVRFVIVNLLSLGLSSALLYVCYDVCHQVLWISKIAATCGGMVLNYVGADQWVFRHGRLEVFDQ
ncbi:MAG: GtrA family protein [Deltaproteobacteria bacterium]